MYEMEDSTCLDITLAISVNLNNILVWLHYMPYLLTALRSTFAIVTSFIFSWSVQSQSGPI